MGDGGSVTARLATLPATKTCNYCVIQWVWAAKSDGGYYMTCADIAITADGLLPDYDLLDRRNQRLTRRWVLEGLVEAVVLVVAVVRAGKFRASF